MARVQDALVLLIVLFGPPRAAKAKVNCRPEKMFNQTYHDCFVQNGVVKLLPVLTKGYLADMNFILAVIGQDLTTVCNHRKMITKALVCAAANETGCIPRKQKGYYTDPEKVGKILKTLCSQRKKMDLKCVKDKTPALFKCGFKKRALHNKKGILDEALNANCIIYPEDVKCIRTELGSCGCSAVEAYQSALIDFGYPPACPPLNATRVKCHKKKPHHHKNKVLPQGPKVKVNCRPEKMFNQTYHDCFVQNGVVKLLPVLTKGYLADRNFILAVIGQDLKIVCNHRKAIKKALVCVATHETSCIPNKEKGYYTDPGKVGKILKTLCSQRKKMDLKCVKDKTPALFKCGFKKRALHNKKGILDEALNANCIIYPEDVKCIQTELASCGCSAVKAYQTALIDFGYPPACPRLNATRVKCHKKIQRHHKKKPQHHKKKPRHHKKKPHHHKKKPHHHKKKPRHHKKKGPPRAAKAKVNCRPEKSFNQTYQDCFVQNGVVKLLPVLTKGYLADMNLILAVIGQDLKTVCSHRQTIKKALVCVTTHESGCLPKKKRKYYTDPGKVGKILKTLCYQRKKMDLKCVKDKTPAVFKCGSHKRALHKEQGILDLGLNAYCIIYHEDVECIRTELDSCGCPVVKAYQTALMNFAYPSACPRLNATRVKCHNKEPRLLKVKEDRDIQNRILLPGPPRAAKAKVNCRPEKSFNQTYQDCFVQNGVVKLLPVLTKVYLADRNFILAVIGQDLSVVCNNRKTVNRALMCATAHDITCAPNDKKGYYPAPAKVGKILDILCNMLNKMDLECVKDKTPALFKCGFKQRAQLNERGLQDKASDASCIIFPEGEECIRKELSSCGCLAVKAYQTALLDFGYPPACPRLNATRVNCHAKNPRLYADNGGQRQEGLTMSLFMSSFLVLSIVFVK